MTGRGLEELLRELAPQVLAVLVRRYGQFDACEDATQEAMLQAARICGTARRPRPHDAGFDIEDAIERLMRDLDDPRGSGSPSEQPAKTADLRQDGAMADRYRTPDGLRKGDRWP